MNATTTRTRKIASIIDKRRPLALKIERVEANLNFLSSALRNLDDHRHDLLKGVDDSNVTTGLQEIDLAKIQSSIAAELEALGKLKVRFCRDTLNIGVVGRARQGKSRLLQSLTGLTAAEIPDGDRQHCTGVRSTIYHNPNVDTYGEVWFHSERSFLDEIITPYYEKLNLGAKPIAIEEFATKPLPPLPKNLPGYAEPGAMYEHLSKYHTYLEKYRHLLRKLSPSRISRNEIREYVAQDTPDGHRVFFNYLAVREVKIVCNFPNADVGQIALVDMPGLGDTGVGDEERLMRTLGQDVDAVLFVRMPKSSGDYWADVDVRLYDTARAALVDLPMELWSLMVLNQTGADSKNGDNSNNCQDLAGDIANKRINVSECVTANCAIPQEANKVLDQVLDYLAAKITDLDHKYAFSCQQRLIQLQGDVNAELEKASKALDQGTGGERGNALFEIKFKEVWKDLTNGLEGLLQHLRQKREEVDTDFKAQVEDALEACRNDTGIPSIAEIEERNNIEKSYAISYAKYLNEIRAHLSKHFLSLDQGLKRSLDRVKSQVAEVLIEKGRLGGLTEAREAEFIKAIALQIPTQLIPGQASQLKFGFELLAEFELSYRGLVQHRIRQHLDVLTPNEPTTLQLSHSPSAQQVLSNLHKSQKEAVYKCENALEELLCEPSQSAFAIVEEFLDRIFRAVDMDIEWRLFLQEVRSQVWGEFQQLGEQTRLRSEWLNSVFLATAANQSDLMEFLK
ncbi:MAG: hypothetical protein DSM106950_36085 [Stigonema ocellatum SAG 48.90 = DSM 106950]|nr:hypothetical protein [Stigonema ocellatum SAG 48.90 = DSM 106950]